MKAISIWEPWASLIACGAKHWETRSWPTSYRGPLLICASKKGLPAYELQRLLSTWEFQGGLAPLVGKPLDLSTKTWSGVKLEHLQFGMAVAICKLADCRPTGSLTQDEIGTNRPFGDFWPGHFAWQLKNIFRIEKPFPVHGRQGLFDVPNDLIPFPGSHAHELA